MNKALKKVLKVPYKGLKAVAPNFAEKLKSSLKHQCPIATLDARLSHVEHEINTARERIIELESIILREYGLRYLNLFNRIDDNSK